MITTRKVFRTDSPDDQHNESERVISRPNDNKNRGRSRRDHSNDRRNRRRSNRSPPPPSMHHHRRNVRKVYETERLSDEEYDTRKRKYRPGDIDGSDVDHSERSPRRRQHSGRMRRRPKRFQSHEERGRPYKKKYNGRKNRSNILEGAEPGKFQIVAFNVPPEDNVEEDLRKFYEEFGEIEEITTKHNKAIITFKTFEAAKSVLKTPKSYKDNRFIKVKMRKLKKKEKPKVVNPIINLKKEWSKKMSDLKKKLSEELKIVREPYKELCGERKKLSIEKSKLIAVATQSIEQIQNLEDGDETKTALMEIATTAAQKMKKVEEELESLNTKISQKQHEIAEIKKEFQRQKFEFVRQFNEKKKELIEDAKPKTIIIRGFLDMKNDLAAFLAESNLAEGIRTVPSGIVVKFESNEEALKWISKLKSEFPTPSGEALNIQWFKGDITRQAVDATKHNPYGADVAMEDEEQDEEEYHEEDDHEEEGHEEEENVEYEEEYNDENDEKDEMEDDEQKLDENKTQERTDEGKGGDYFEFEEEDSDSDLDVDLSQVNLEDLELDDDDDEE